MDSPFRLLVYAIAAIALVAIAYFIMLPFLFPQPDNVGLIGESLKASEAGTGLSFSRETVFQEDDGFSGKTFDTGNRNVAFQCNNADLCCPQGQECSLAIEWDSRLVKFNQTRETVVTTRCEMEHGLFACDVYIGEKPGQIKIDSVEAPEEMDLSQGKMYFDISFSNIGSLEAVQTEAIIEVLQLYQEEGRWIERPVESASKIEAIGNLGAGESTEEIVYINLNQNGQFRAKIRVAGIEAGYDEKSVEFSTSGASDRCMASSCENPLLEEGKCTARCYCQDCMLGNRCANKLLEAVNLDLGLPKDVTLDNAVPDILGSNIVDMALPAEMCPSDIVIEAANAPLNEIAVTLKNISENPVQKPFSINAYLNQQKIGTATVQPEEINESGSVIKSVLVSLSPGTYEADLVANEEIDGERSEKEEDYENNTGRVTIKIPEPIVEPPHASFENPLVTGMCCGVPIMVNHLNWAEDTTGAISLRQAIDQDKVRVDIRDASIIRIQNITDKHLKVEIPLGQIFVEKAKQTQNMGQGQVKQPVPTSNKVIEIPVCTISVNTLITYCLNFEREMPTATFYDVGEVITETTVLDALKLNHQETIWNAVDTVSTDPKNYGFFGNILEPNPIDLSASIQIEQSRCDELGFINISTCTNWDWPPIADPDDVDLKPFCDMP